MKLNLSETTHTGKPVFQNVDLGFKIFKFYTLPMIEFGCLNRNSVPELILHIILSEADNRNSTRNFDRVVGEDCPTLKP
jgi:hypothetical protein